jgi:hypothetical protein
MVQAFPHPPQFSRFVAGSTQAALQQLSEPGQGELALHIGTHSPAEQTSPAEQSPFARQVTHSWFATSHRLPLHPSSARHPSMHSRRSGLQC